MSRTHMQLGESSRRHEKLAHEERGRIGPKRPWADWPGPFSAWFGLPFDLAPLQSISSHGAKSHGGIHSSSASEEQRREGHHPGEERVEMFD
jgi:hypothetical protein